MLEVTPEPNLVIRLNEEDGRVFGMRSIGWQPAARRGPAGYALVTDDRKARRIAASVAAPIPLLATSEFLCHWAQSNNISSDRIGKCLPRLNSARDFGPSRSTPCETGGAAC